MTNWYLLRPSKASFLAKPPLIKFHSPPHSPEPAPPAKKQKHGKSRGTGKGLDYGLPDNNEESIRDKKKTQTSQKKLANRFSPQQGEEYWALSYLSAFGLKHASTSWMGQPFYKVDGDKVVEGLKSGEVYQILTHYQKVGFASPGV